MRKTTAIVLTGAMLLSLVLLLSGCASGTGANAAYKQVSQDEALKLMESEENYIILDVRTEAEFAEKHIRGAVNIPNETIGSSPIAELPDKAQLILVYCRSGNRSKQAADKLARLGYTNIVEFGGINTWTGDTETGSN